MRIACAQLNTVVGDIAGNSALVRDAVAESFALGADLVLTPELAVAGYPPEDLLLRPAFARDCAEAVHALAREVRHGVAVIGFAEWDRDCFNSAAVVADGRVQAVYRKRFLPNYGVFDEARYFRSGDAPLVVDLAGMRVGLTVCEDIWYPSPVTSDLAAAGVDLVVCISASPWHRGKGDARERMLATRASDAAAALAFCNQVGGQDELVFDGAGMVVNEKGEVVARGKPFEEDLVMADLDADSVSTARMGGVNRRKTGKKPGPGVRTIDLGAAPAGKTLTRLTKRRPAGLEEKEEVLRALVLGTRDYLRKNGFRHAVIGLSGGIDSALVASVAVLALGKENVTGVLMPSRYTSKESIEDAKALARNTGMRTLTIPIEKPFLAYLEIMKNAFRGTRPNEAEENMQARIRGNILMALSNKFGWLVLTTGNKSEMSVGYSTLYGDMAGGFAVIKDLPKTLVYRVAKRVNELEGREVIPERVFTKVPTAELRPDQTDQDTLPPYDVLDRILKAYVEEDRSIEEIAALGFEKELVREVARMVDRSEYKRRQAPPGIKITPRALGKDRRMPITNRYENGGR